MAAGPDPEKNIVTELGIVGLEIDQKIAAAARGLRGPTGVIVVARTAGARSEARLLPRDIIRSLNNRPIATVDGLRQLVRSLTPGTPVTLQIQREGRLMYLPFIYE